MKKLFFHSGFKELLFVLIGATLVGLSYNTFLLPAKLAAGGLSGVSTILYEMYSWSPALTQVIMNIPIFIIGWVTLGKEFSGKTVVGTFWVRFFIWLSEYILYTFIITVLGTVYD